MNKFVFKAVRRRVVTNHMFTFISLTYNHEKFIIMHLESIKYQIQNYFKGIQIALIIADDGSADGTVRLCEQWLRKNQGMFHEYMILHDGVNRGTCGNMLRAFDNLKSNLYFLLAGDDIYSYGNLKAAIHYLEKYDIVSSPCPAFFKDKDGEYVIDTDYSHYKTSIACAQCLPILRRAFTVSGCLLEAPPTVFRRKLLEKDVAAFVSDFKLIEDQPLMYGLFKKNRLKMAYLSWAYVMYRVNEGSISHTDDKSITGAVKQDLDKLTEYYSAHERTLFYKYLVFLRKQVLRGRKWASFLYPTNHYLVLMQKVFNKRIKEYYKKAIMDTAPQSFVHVKMLEQRANAFLAECQAGGQDEKV